MIFSPAVTAETQSPRSQCTLTGKYELSELQLEAQLYRLGIISQRNDEIQFSECVTL